MMTEGSVAAEQGAIQNAACAHPACELSAGVRQRWESAGSEVRYSAEQARIKAEQALGRVQRQIEGRPLVALAATVVGCLAAGMAAAWWIRFRRSA
jgi:hypothetical protein